MRKQAISNIDNETEQRKGIVARMMHAIINMPLFQAALFDETIDKEDEFGTITITDEETAKQIEALRKDSLQRDADIAKSIADEEKAFRARQKLNGSTIQTPKPRVKKLSEEQMQKVSSQMIKDQISEDENDLTR